MSRSDDIPVVTPHTPRVDKTPAAVREALDPDWRAQFEHAYWQALAQDEKFLEGQAVAALVEDWWPRAQLCQRPGGREQAAREEREYLASIKPVPAETGGPAPAGVDEVVSPYAPRVPRTATAVRDMLDPDWREEFEAEWRAALDKAKETFDLADAFHAVERWWPRAQLCAKPGAREQVERVEREIAAGTFVGIPYDPETDDL